MKTPSFPRRRFAFGAAALAILPLGTVRPVRAAVETHAPALTALVAPRAAELQAAGIQSILARTGKRRRDIQVLTQWGPAYFGWPKGVAPVVFEIYVARNGTAQVYTEGYGESNKARYAAALDAVVPEAIRQARNVRAAFLRPKP